MCVRLTKYPVSSMSLPLSSAVTFTSLAAHFMLGTIITRLLLNSDDSPHFLTLSRNFFEGKRFRTFGGLISCSSYCSEPVAFIFIGYDT